MILNKNNLSTTIHLIDLLIKLNQIESITIVYILNTKYDIKKGYCFSPDDSELTLIGIDYYDLTSGEEPENNVIEIQLCEPYDIMPFMVKDIERIVIKTKDGEIL